MEHDTGEGTQEANAGLALTRRDLFEISGLALAAAALPSKVAFASAARFGPSAAQETGSVMESLSSYMSEARSRALRTIAKIRRTAEMIAATEDRVAATLQELAPRRPGASDDMLALSRLASGYARYLREHIRDGPAPQASPAAATAGRSSDDAGTLQRAMAFIHEHARDDISAADIAGAACVTTRAVQLAFRRYAGTTPMGYLRQVRLDQAHRELLAARPAPGIVTRIAADWQFGNPGRFTAYYRAAFGVLPSQTLQDGSRAGSG